MSFRWKGISRRYFKEVKLIYRVRILNNDTVMTIHKSYEYNES